MSRWSGALKNSGYRCIMMGEGSMCKGRTINSNKKPKMWVGGARSGVWNRPSTGWGALKTM